MSSSIKDFLDKLFDLCREYQQEIPPQKMAEISREYADRLNGWIVMADLIKDIKYHNFSKTLSKFFIKLAYKNCLRSIIIICYGYFFIWEWLR